MQENIDEQAQHTRFFLYDIKDRKMSLYNSEKIIQVEQGKAKYGF